MLEYLPIVATTANVTLYLEDAESDPAQVNLALPLTLLPALIATKTALTSSAASVTTGQSVTFTATVTIPTGGTAGGTVSFFNGPTLLGSATLNAKGVATLTTTFSTAGTDKITASYNGTTTYAPSKSAVLTETITAKK